MKKFQISAEKRKIAGKKVKTLRKQGLLPANVYGKNIKSLAVQLPLKEFSQVFKEIGETGLAELNVSGEDRMRPVLIHNVQMDPITSQPLHTDFFQVDLKEKVTTMVPLEIVGEAQAIKDKKGVLLQTLNEVEVEALPTDLPEKIEVDVSSLSEVDQEIKAASLKIPAGVKVLTGGDLVVCKIGALVTAEMEAEIKKEEEAAAAAGAEQVAPTAEGAPPAQETQSSEEKTAPSVEK